MGFGTLALIVLAAYSLTFAIQEEKFPSFVNKTIEKLAEKSKWFSSLKSCSFCLGFWMGLLVYTIVSIPSLATNGFVLTFMVNFLVVGLSTASGSFVLNQLTLMAPSDDVEISPEEMGRMLLEAYASDSEESCGCDCDGEESECACDNCGEKQA